MPLINQIYESKKKKLGFRYTSSWDIEAEPEGIQPLRPFKTAKISRKNNSISIPSVLSLRLLKEK